MHRGRWAEFKLLISERKLAGKNPPFNQSGNAGKPTDILISFITTVGRHKFRRLEWKLSQCNGGCVCGTAASSLTARSDWNSFISVHDSGVVVVSTPESAQQ